MPSKSKSQQHLFGIALSIKRGEKDITKVPEKYRDEVKSIVDGMTEDQIRDYAKTNTKKLPDKVEEQFLSVPLYENFKSQEYDLSDIFLFFKEKGYGDDKILKIKNSLDEFKDKISLNNLQNSLLKLGLNPYELQNLITQLNIDIDTND